MNSEQEKKNLITEGNLVKALLVFFFPIVFGTFFQQLYNTADAIVVGRFVSKEALGAVGGNTGALINLLIGFFGGLSSGASVIIAQYYGGKKQTELKHAIHTSLAIAIIGGLFLMVFGVIFSPMMVKAIHTPPEILGYSVTYLRIYFLGVIPNLIYNMGFAILRAIGDSKRPLYYLIISCVTNIILDLIFVALLDMKITGVALGTVLSQLISAILVLRALMTTKESYKVIPKEIRLHGYIIKRVFYLGFPAAIQSSMYSITNVMIQAYVNGINNNVIAGWTAYTKIDAIFWMIINALGISIATVVGQNYGARQMDRVKKTIKTGMILAFTMSAVLVTILYVLGPILLTLFTTDTDVITEGLNILHYLLPTFLTYVAIEVFVSALRGCGDSIIPMVMVCFGICFLRIIWLITATPRIPGIHTILFSYPLTWTVTTIMFTIYYNIRKKTLYCNVSC